MLRGCLKRTVSPCVNAFWRDLIRALNSADTQGASSMWSLMVLRGMMVSSPIFTRSWKSCSLLSQSGTESRTDESIEPKYVPGSHLRLGRVSLRVRERRLQVLRMLLNLGSSRTTKWSDRPEGENVCIRSLLQNWDMLVIVRSSVWSPLVGTRTSCLSLNSVSRPLILRRLKSPVRSMPHPG